MQLFPEKFQNKTNGVTPRRWLAYCNPELSALITETLGSDSWVTDTVQLQKLKKVSTDAAFQAKWKAVKQLKKAKLAAMIKQIHGDDVNMNALFDIQVCVPHGQWWASCILGSERAGSALNHAAADQHSLHPCSTCSEVCSRCHPASGCTAHNLLGAALQIKRIHEYKRQYMNVLSVIWRYKQLKKMTPEERKKQVPRVCVIAGKAASAYDMAKRIIHLINAVGTCLGCSPASMHCAMLALLFTNGPAVSICVIHTLDTGTQAGCLQAAAKLDHGHVPVAGAGATVSCSHHPACHCAGAKINHDEDTSDLLRLYFLPDYNVTMAETMIPASELSQHISTAGTEASGTSNMKFQMNGCLIIGTMDGANIEIAEESGEWHALWLPSPCHVGGTCQGLTACMHAHTVLHICHLCENHQGCAAQWNCANTMPMPSATHASLAAAPYRRGQHVRVRRGRQGHPQAAQGAQGPEDGPPLGRDHERHRGRHVRRQGLLQAPGGQREQHEGEGQQGGPGCGAQAQPGSNILPAEACVGSGHCGSVSSSIMVRTHPRYTSAGTHAMPVPRSCAGKLC